MHRALQRRDGESRHLLLAVILSRIASQRLRGHLLSRLAPIPFLAVTFLAVTAFALLSARRVPTNNTHSFPDRVYSHHCRARIPSLLSLCICITHLEHVYHCILCYCRNMGPEREPLRLRLRRSCLLCSCRNCATHPVDLGGRVVMDETDPHDAVVVDVEARHAGQERVCIHVADLRTDLAGTHKVSVQGLAGSRVGCLATLGECHGRCALSSGTRVAEHHESGRGLLLRSEKREELLCEGMLLLGEAGITLVERTVDVAAARRALCARRRQRGVVNPWRKAIILDATLGRGGSASATEPGQIAGEAKTRKRQPALASSEDVIASIATVSLTQQRRQCSQSARTARCSPGTGTCYP